MCASLAAPELSDRAGASKAMRLWAISDLHVTSDVNRRAVEQMPAAPGDWLLLPGDIADTMADLALVFRTLRPRFARVIWTPGNHELWREPAAPEAPVGAARYAALVALARAHDVLTPEDPYPLWPGDGPATLIAPLFTHYDYSLRPPEVARDAVARWAAAGGVFAADERRLLPEPYADQAQWCRVRVEQTLERLAQIPADLRTVLVNHYPLRPEDVVLPRRPR